MMNRGYLAQNYVLRETENKAIVLFFSFLTDYQCQIYCIMNPHLMRLNDEMDICIVIATTFLRWF